MAPPHAIDSEVSSLRAIAYRLSSTPATQLPQLAPHIASQLVTCGQLLSSGQNAFAKENGDAPVVLHKFKTQLSTLLQDRAVEARWAAVVIIKSTVEVGGWEILQDAKCAAWVRGMVGILNKPDPATTKKLCIITLTRIFMLTRDYPTLVREMTTPSLKPFVDHCLHHYQTANIQETSVQRALLQPILESFTHLVPRHPTIFRTALSKLRKLLAAVMSEGTYHLDVKELYTIPQEICNLAQRLYVLLHQCAPKDRAAVEWHEDFCGLVSGTHDTAGEVFRGIVEDWQSTTRPPGSTRITDHFSDAPLHIPAAPFHLRPWTGILSGGHRLATQLFILRAYVSTTLSTPTSLDIGVIADLLTRILSIQKPSKNTPGTRPNDQISRQERDELWTVLPRIQIAALEVWLALLTRLNSGSMSTCIPLLETTTWLFPTAAPPLRTAIYTLLAPLLSIIGPSLPKPLVVSLDPILKSVARDLLPPTTSAPSTGKGPATANPDAMTGPRAPSAPKAQYAGLHHAARALLPVLLAKLPPHHVSATARADLDRVAVLTRDCAALTASALNPAPGKPSVLPFLARLFPEAVQVEGVLRPRMPVIRFGTQVGGDEDDSDDDMLDGAEAELPPPPTAGRRVELSRDIFAARPARDDGGDLIKGVGVPTHAVSAPRSPSAEAEGKREAEIPLLPHAKRPRLTSETPATNDDARAAPPTAEASAAARRQAEWQAHPEASAAWAERQAELSSEIWATEQERIATAAATKAARRETARRHDARREAARASGLDSGGWASMEADIAREQEAEEDARREAAKAAAMREEAEDARRQAAVVARLDAVAAAATAARLEATARQEAAPAAGQDDSGSDSDDEFEIPPLVLRDSEDEE
ncbi:hypothetical protein EJ06DRAFT_526311 [Trichodelitschia bisporula]|uniref:Pre-rRNA-processing protein RIX1 n=1 Tax=Trichodelitschia bisporula TaxID=703511 RepID=A0A6G1I7F0_9PEZI|nr:hypothetical protein EJ06DRAFT_526311 [Trichodelitschia bisporula]